MNPILSLLQTTAYLISGRLHFPGDRIGEILVMEDGQRFTIFRQATVAPGHDQPERAEAIFTVRFRVAGLSVRQNQIFSLLPIPFFVGLPGFRAKLWALDDHTGTFQGLYHWQTTANAQAYARSFAMRFMTWRAEPGSLTHRITPNEREATSQAA